MSANLPESDRAAQLPPSVPELAELLETRLGRLEGAGVALESITDPDSRRALEALCLGSDWAVDWLTREPAALDELLAADLHRRVPSRQDLDAELRARLDKLPPEAEEHRPDSALGALLRDFRNRHQIGIQMRDLAGFASLEDTVGVLSELAAAIIDAVLERLQARAVEAWGEPLNAAGEPQRMIVLAMGKLGAGELNLSSDVDLIFAHPESGRVEPPGGGEPMTIQEFFVRLGRRLIGLLDTRTPKGFVFRVDMRLRPFGDSGPLVQHLEALLDYYEEQGRDWERYALIKARPIAGDLEAGERLIRGMRPFVYRRYLDFGAIEALRGMKTLIRREVRRRRLQDDVKQGEGGIREVEFIAQVFQLIHGGRDVRFQERRLLVVLERLREAGFLPETDVDELDRAYRFLRALEHRIQALDDEQTQQLPADPQRRARLAWSMGLADEAALMTELESHRGRVAEHFAGLIRPVEDEEDAESADLAPWVELWADPGGDEADPALLEASGYTDPGAAVERLRALRRAREEGVTQEVGRQRLDALMPRLLLRVAALKDPDPALSRCLRLVESVLRRTAYMVLLVENPGALDQLVRLASGSDWIAATLARHPILLDELLDVRHLYTAPTAEVLHQELEEHLRGVPEDDLEQLMEQLRYFKEATELRVAACELGDILPLMKVSDALTWLADAVLERVVSMAWRQTVAQYGRPRDADGSVREHGFGVVGYGKYGGYELGWGSDLDLVFLHDLEGGGTTDGERQVVNGQFVARLGQRVIHLLTTRTLTGELYEVDMRLRPSGRSGMLVSSLEAFHSYQQTDAWTWEHQALVRARPVVGPPGLVQGFETVRRDILGREREREKLREEIVRMRRRMLAELAGIRERPGPDALADRAELDLKQGPGAVVDIEFMVQFRVLGWARSHPELLRYTDAIRILETARAEEIIAADEAGFLIESYKEFRAEAHRRALENQPARTDRADLIDRANRVATLWMEHMEPTATA